MTTLSELIAAADKAAAGNGKPKSDKNYYVNAAKEGFAEGVGNVADAPGRILSLLKAAGGMAMAPFVKDAGDLPQVDTGFSNFNTDALKRLLGVEQIEPTSKGQEVVGGVLRGAASLPLPLAAGGSALAQTAKTALVGGLAGGGAVGGGQAAEAIAPDSPMAKMAGMLAGGLAGGVVLPSAGGVLGVYNRMKQGAEDLATNTDIQGKAKTVAEKIVDRQVKDAVSGTPRAAENITEALRLRDRIGPNFNPSVAEMADSPGLTEMQRRFSLTTPQRLNQEIARDEMGVQAVRDFYNKYAGKPAQPGAIRSAVNQSLSDENAAVAGKAEALAGRLKPADQNAIGNKASELAFAEREAAKPAITAAYEKAFEAAGDARVNLSPVVSKVEEILGTKLAQVKPESAPQTVSAIQRLFKQSGDKTPDELSYLASRIGGALENPQTARAQVTLRDIDDIRKAINADVASAARSSDPSAAMRMRNLSQVHRAIDEAVTNSAVPDTAKTLYANAIQKYRNEFVPRFKEGANYQMFKDTSLNEPRIIADKFTTTYFKPDAQGGVNAGQQFSKLFGANPEAKDLTRQGIMDIYRQKVVNPQTGQIDVAAHNRFQRDYGRTMEQFRSAGINVKDEIAGIGQQAEKLTQFGDKLLSLTKSLRYDTTDDLISGALSSPKVMGNVLVRLGSEQRQNMQRVLMDKAWESGTGAGMQKYLTENAQTLKMALSPQHLQDMTDISKALAITERAPVRGVLASGGPDVLKNATGVSMATVWSQYRAVTGGRQGPATAVFNLSAPVMTKLSQTNFNDVMQTALHDPATARALRDFLVSNQSGAANASASGLMARLAQAAKTGAGIVWDSKGHIAKIAIGTENYGNNLGRAANAISVNADK